jgi:predicted ATPase
MLSHISIERFKSIVELNLDLGRLNVFIGANGSGKSNLLEAIGVLGAAAFGRVDDETLQRRGVRLGIPRLYKTAFKLGSSVPHILFKALAETGASYDVTLWNPIDKPSPAWRFKTENLRRSEKDQVSGRTTTSAGKHNQEQGLAALETVKLGPDDPARILMDLLRGYSIYCPNTPSLRGLTPDAQTREPVGLSGGRLPEAVDELLAAGRKDTELERALDQVRELLTWAREFSAAPSTSVPLSPSAARSRFVIQFVDRFMAPKRNKLTGYDASEGALYILFCAVLFLHPRSPHCLAVDNMDQTLNPRLAQRLMEAVCTWSNRANVKRQWLVTVHNPAVLDGIPLDDPGVKLYTVDRNDSGHTVIRPIDLETAAGQRPGPDWTLSRMWMNGLLGGVPNV